MSWFPSRAADLSYRGREQQDAVLLLVGSLKSGGRPSSADARLYKALSMRLPMADMIAAYGSDVHQILGEEMDGPTGFNQLKIACPRRMRSGRPG
ncbi:MULTISPECIES: hypothetical protein [Streptomyces]|uniref:hypothetical protein n=1 Tax=Streptomyces TaxID=1883 RepID=UPI000D13F0FE|nr:hypothetical protein [Streptomyces griseolus]